MDTLDRPQALGLLLDVAAWNEARAIGKPVPSFSGVDLSEVNLSGINLSELNLKRAELVEADLSGADLSGTDLEGAHLFQANLSGADLSNARLRNANLRWAKLTQADLSGAHLKGADLFKANLSGALLREARLNEVNFNQADLSGADLSGAGISSTSFVNAELAECVLQEAFVHAAFNETDLEGADFTNAKLYGSMFAATDLSLAKGLNSVIHRGPSSIGSDTLAASKGGIPEEFLRGCGLSPWEIQAARLHDPALTANEISNIVSTDLFAQRTEGPLYLGGIFLSYSRSDSEFVDKLYESLRSAGASVWLDRHEMLAGRVERQVCEAIRLNDIVILVLSEASIASDWVEGELEMARLKEIDLSRDVLCPVALDDSWKEKAADLTLWRQLRKYNVLDFSAWRTDGFDPVFEKLRKGLKVHYAR